MWQITSATVETRRRPLLLGEGARRRRQRRRRLRGDAPDDRHRLGRALFILGLISLSLAIVNLFPFLPLDGGHIFWALAEKVRGRPIPFRTMEKASVVGFVLVIVLFFFGFTNDVERLMDGTFDREFSR